MRIIVCLCGLYSALCSFLRIIVCLFWPFSFYHCVVFCVYEKKAYTVVVNNPTYINNQLSLQCTTQKVPIHMALEIQVLTLDRQSSVVGLGVNWVSNANTDINKQ
jgi:hypothetical protein